MTTYQPRAAIEVIGVVAGVGTALFIGTMLAVAFIGLVPGWALALLCGAAVIGIPVPVLRAVRNLSVRLDASAKPQ